MYCVMTPESQKMAASVLLMVARFAAAGDPELAELLQKHGVTVKSKSESPMEALSRMAEFVQQMEEGDQAEESPIKFRNTKSGWLIHVGGQQNPWKSVVSRSVPSIPSPDTGAFPSSPQGSRSPAAPAYQSERPFTQQDSPAPARPPVDEPPPGSLPRAVSRGLERQFDRRYQYNHLAFANDDGSSMAGNRPIDGELVYTAFPGQRIVFRKDVSIAGYQFRTGTQLKKDDNGWWSVMD
jgi:hypothetical protein